MADVHFVRTIGGLSPVDDAAKEALNHYGNGEILRVKLYRDRNPRHHRLFFGLLNLVFQNQQRYLSQEALRFAITIQAGYVDEIRLSGDRVALKPKSISFGSMDQGDFSKFYTAALLAIKELLPELGTVDWERELMTSGAV
jgi:Protein of unknown function (DUF1367)